MNNYKTCKHWEPRNEYETGYRQGLGRCAAALMLWDCTEWRDDSDERVFMKAHENAKAFVQDGSDYRAYLLTKPDFGCISHEANP